MSFVCSSATLSSLEEGFQNKIEALKICNDLRGGWAGDTVEDCGQLSVEVNQLQRDLVWYRNMLSQARKDLAAARTLIEQVQQLSARLTHMKTNMPSHIPRPGGQASPQHDHIKKPPVQTKDNPPANAQEKSAAKVGPQKTRQVKTVHFITVEEFESVPKYIRGRLQYDQVNDAVSEVNRALEAKYALMVRPRNKLSETDMTIVRACKYQENQETKGVHFVVGDDIKRWSALRMDSCGRSLLTILRTLRRLREIRGPGNIVRFAAV